jgi:hypothetical protein
MRLLLIRARAAAVAVAVPRSSGSIRLRKIAELQADVKEKMMGG